jgi:hypothetical protein
LNGGVNAADLRSAPFKEKRMNVKKLAIASLALAGLLAAASVDARGRDDVQFSVTIGSPFYGPPPPLFVPGRVLAPRYDVRPVYRPYHVAPTRWDRDGDGIPNRYDRVYNPRWDRDGDGIPNRYDRRDSRYDGRGSRW